MFDIVEIRKGSRTISNYSVGTGAAVQIAAMNLNRKSITIQNQGSQTVFIGDASVATSGSDRGYALFTGATFTDNASVNEWYALSSSGTQALNIIEVS